MEVILFHLGLASYGAGTAAGLVGLRRPGGLVSAVRLLALAGALLHAAYLVAVGCADAAFPARTIAEFSLVLVTLTVLAALAFDVIRGMPILSLVAAPLGLVVAGGAWSVRTPGPSLERLPLESFWTGLHVFAALGAYALFSIAFLAALAWLAVQRSLKRHREGRWLDHLPSLEGAMRTNRLCSAAGFLLLTASILIGYLYARSLPVGRLGAGWRVDPKILTATGTWACYLALGIVDLVPRLRGRTLAVLSIAGFSLVALSLWTSVAWTDFHRFF